MIATKQFQVIPKIIEKIPSNIKLNFVNAEGQTLLHDFVLNFVGSDTNTDKDLEQLVTLLISRGVEIYRKDNLKRTVLWYCSQNLQLVKFFTTYYTLDFSMYHLSTCLTAYPDFYPIFHRFGIVLGHKTVITFCESIYNYRVLII